MDQVFVANLRKRFDRPTLCLQRGVVVEVVNPHQSRCTIGYATFGGAWPPGQHCVVPVEAFYEPDWRTRYQSFAYSDSKSATGVVLGSGTASNWSAGYGRKKSMDCSAGASSQAA
jgi:hypothetical protein